MVWLRTVGGSETTVKARHQSVTLYCQAKPVEVEEERLHFTKWLIHLGISQNNWKVQAFHNMTKIYWFFLHNLTDVLLGISQNDWKVQTFHKMTSSKLTGEMFIILIAILILLINYDLASLSWCVL